MKKRMLFKALHAVRTLSHAVQVSEEKTNFFIIKTFGIKLRPIHGNVCMPISLGGLVRRLSKWKNFSPLECPTIHVLCKNWSTCSITRKRQIIRGLKYRNYCIRKVTDKKQFRKGNGALLFLFRPLSLSYSVSLLLPPAASALRCFGKMVTRTPSEVYSERQCLYFGRIKISTPLNRLQLATAKVKFKDCSMGVSVNSEPPNYRNIDSDKIKRKNFNDVHCTIKLFPNTKKKRSCTVSLAHPTRASDFLKNELYPIGSEKKLQHFNQQQNTREDFWHLHIRLSSCLTSELSIEPAWIKLHERNTTII